MTMRSIQDQLRDAARTVSDSIAEHRELYIRAWIASTGLRPEECELHQEIRHTEDGVTYVCRVERRKTNG